MLRALGAGCALAMAGCSTVASGDRAAAPALAAASPTQARSGPALRLARASRANGDFASAINLYRSVTALPPEDPALLVELGDTLVDAASIDEGIEIYQKIQQRAGLAPAVRLEALLGLQQAYLTLGEPDQALRYAVQATALAPADHRVLVCRGVALDLLGRHAEAQKAYRAVLVNAPRDVAARNDLALSLALTAHFDDAVEIMTSMARSSNATPRIRQNLALIYGLAGDVPHAAALSRVDLDSNATDGNLRFFEFARGGAP
jgi:Flp pilus assembly protein TadD